MRTSTVFGTVIGLAMTAVMLAAAQDRAAADGVYTQEQAKRGDAAYQRACASCHMPDLSGGGFAPALGEETFAARWRGEPVGDLFTIVKATMPANEPQSLRDDEYADIVAFLLSRNGYPAGEKQLSSNVDELKHVLFRKS
jgi:quinoprotein glucose dehydrogenase